MNQKQASLDEVRLSCSLAGAASDPGQRVGYFDKTFQEFESKASRLQELLMVQISNHSQFQETLHTDLRIAQSLLNDVTNSAANLALTLEESLQRVNKFTSIGGLLTSPSWRTWVLFIFCILIIFAPRLVAACLLLLGKMVYRQSTSLS